MKFGWNIRSIWKLPIWRADTLILDQLQDTVADASAGAAESASDTAANAAATATKYATTASDAARGGADAATQAAADTAHAGQKKTREGVPSVGQGLVSEHRGGGYVQ